MEPPYENQMQTTPICFLMYQQSEIPVIWAGFKHPLNRRASQSALDGGAAKSIISSIPAGKSRWGILEFALGEVPSEHLVFSCQSSMATQACTTATIVSP